MTSTISAIGIDAGFTGWLHRAYLDLGAVPAKAPHHLWGLDFGIRALSEGKAYPRIQSALNPSFRQALIHQTGLFAYDVRSPLELATSLSTPRWRLLCEMCRGFDGLEPRVQVRVAWLLGKLCFQDYLLSLVPEGVVRRVSESEELASLAYLRAYARCRKNLDDAASPYSLAEFEQIAREGRPCISYIDAHYQMVAQNVKNRNDLSQVEYWQPRHLTAIERSRSTLDEFTYLLVMSRYHRVGGFLPQMRQDKENMVREMDLAEEYARALPRNDEVQATAADEMLYPVLESRTKEALWLGDLDLALERARQTTALSPYDARAWLHQGQVLLERGEVEAARSAYSKSARLSPPGREVALFMVGQCCEELGDLEAACDAYLGSLASDPLGISSAERLLELAASLDLQPILQWTRSRLELLTELQERVKPAPPAAYKDFPRPPAEERSHA